MLIPFFDKLCAGCHHYFPLVHCLLIVTICFMFCSLFLPPGFSLLTVPAFSLQLLSLMTLLIKTSLSALCSSSLSVRCSLIPSGKFFVPPADGRDHLEVSLEYAAISSITSATNMNSRKVCTYCLEQIGET